MQPDATAPSILAEQPGIGQILLLVLYLVLILVGVFFATRFFAKVAQRAAVPGARGGSRFQPGRHIRLIDRMSLDRERCILLFEADGRRYLVGVSGESFVLLNAGEAPPPEEVQEEGGASSFRDFLSVWKQRGNGQQGEDEHAPEG